MAILASINAYTKSYTGLCKYMASFVVEKGVVAQIIECDSYLN